MSAFGAYPALLDRVRRARPAADPAALPQARLLGFGLACLVQLLLMLALILLF
jgi:hypothetical protein